jgi:hypothetical protein
VTRDRVAGVAGTAITADLGARKVREELDALQVLGVDPVKNLVVPRFLALMLVTGLFDIYALLFGIFGGIIAELVNGQPLGPFWATLFANASTTDLWGSVLKTHDLRRDHRDRLLLQGHDRLRRRRGRRARGQRGGRDRLLGDLRLQLRLHPDAAGDPPPDPRDQDERAAGNAARMARGDRRDRALHGPRSSATSTGCASSASSARRCARRHPDRRLDA